MAAEPEAVIEEEPEPSREPPPFDPVAATAAVEDAAAAGDAIATRELALAAATGHRAAGQLHAAIDVCYLALATSPADPGLHLTLAELYLDLGWRTTAVDKLVLMARLAELGDDTETRAAAVRGRRGAPAGRSARWSRSAPEARLRAGEPGSSGARCYTRATMTEFLGSILEQVRLTTLVDIGITALLIYWLFSLIRGTRAVRLVIGVSVLFVVYVLAVAFGLELLTRILQGGAVVGLFALVVIFQPEIRRALERIGRVGSLGWVLSPADSRAVDHVADEVARAAADLSADGHGALIVLERETGLEDAAESGVMIHGDISADLIRTIFAPRTALHDGALIIRGETILAAGALLPLSETSVHAERFGTRHRAALGIAEQTDAVVDRRVRGERPDQPRRTLAHRAQPERGAPGALDPASARPEPGAPPRRVRVAPGAGADHPLGRTGSAVTRALRVLVHNWPLKLAAIGLATLLYGGLVFAQSTQSFHGVIPVEVRGQARRHLPADRSSSRSRPSAISRRRAPARSPRRSRPGSTSSGIEPGSGLKSVPVTCESIDDRISVVGETCPIA